MVYLWFIVGKEAATKPKAMSDEKNPAYTFNLTDSDILSMILNGKIDAFELASLAMAGRGNDANGMWVGFKEAKRLHIERMSNKS